MIFFLDRNLGRRAHRLLVDSHPELVFHFLDDHFKQDTPDPEWIAHVGRNQWPAFTADDCISRRQAELLAVREHKVQLFTLTSNNMTGETKGQIFSDAIPKIIAALATKGPWIVKVHRDGRLARGWPLEDTDQEGDAAPTEPQPALSKGRAPRTIKTAPTPQGRSGP